MLGTWGAGRWGAAVADERITHIDAATAPLRGRIADHAVSEMLGDIGSVRTFMEHHVVAVWDFMSLLKCLQRHVTCVDVPWIPRGDPAHRRFVNELVLAEESDVGVNGGYTSHLELYMGAMTEAGADTRPISALLDNVAAGAAEPIAGCGFPPAAAAFAESTLATARSSPAHRVAASFAFGRERLIPSMFVALRAMAQRSTPSLPLLVAYLDRHIELDAEEHTPLAFSLVRGLCGDDPRRWGEAEESAVEACEQRLRLWDAAAAAMSMGDEAQRH